MTRVIFFKSDIMKGLKGSVAPNHKWETRTAGTNGKYKYTYRKETRKNNKMSMVDCEKWEKWAIERGHKVGVRWDNDSWKRGDVMPHSSEIDGDTGEITRKNEGTSSIDFRAYKLNPSRYNAIYGPGRSTAYLIVGDMVGSGTDENEILLRRATVIGKIREMDTLKQ